MDASDVHARTRAREYAQDMHLRNACNHDRRVPTQVRMLLNTASGVPSLVNNRVLVFGPHRYITNVCSESVFIVADPRVVVTNVGLYGNTEQIHYIVPEKFAYRCDTGIIDIADMCLITTQHGAQIRICTSTLTRCERRTHVSPRLWRRNIIEIIDVVHTLKRYDCTGVIPMLPTVPYKHRIRCTHTRVVLVHTHVHTHVRTRTRTRARSLSVWDPNTRVGMRLRIGRRAHVVRNHAGVIEIDDVCYDFDAYELQPSGKYAMRP